MAWNNHRRRTRPADTKSAIGDSYVDEAIVKLTQIQQRAVTVMTSYEVSRSETIRALFTNEDIAAAANARGIVTPNTTDIAYEIRTNDDNTWSPVQWGGPVSFAIRYDGAGILPINAERLQPNAGARPLYAFIDAVAAVHLQYEEVKYCLRWLNRNATPGAIRYYWPTALKLCPKAPVFTNLQEVPSRHGIPAGISEFATLFRATATTMAAAAMLPEDVQPRTRKQMWLTFNGRKVQRQGIEFSSDYMTYCI